MKNSVETDVLVIGSGIAGISFALQAAEKYKVTVVTKDEAFFSNTIYAQGGIACAWANTDHPRKHVADTLTAGAGLCNRRAVEALAYEAPAALQNLIENNVPFCRDNSGTIQLGREGGHSQNRIMHVYDYTGKAVQEVLLKKAIANPNITLLTHHFALDILVDDHICYGAKILDTNKNQLKVYTAHYTALCTGGAGQVFTQTTNPQIATGDGIAMAYRAGAKLKHLEFVQFHPTALYHPQANGFLISEALRGAGAYLTNAEGKPFMQKYHAMADLAPRDIVSRAIVHEMQRSGADCAYLDATHIAEQRLLNEFPQIYKTCNDLGIDISRQKIPVVPSAHYMCGGVLTNLNAQTSIRHLYAFGEVACTGVHGANRLASNSLLEGLVFAQRAYKHLARRFQKINIYHVSNPVLEKPVEDDLDINALKQEIKFIMSRDFGIVRSRRSMLKSYKKLNHYLNICRKLTAQHPFNTQVIELCNTAQVAVLIAKAALQRRKSVGAHFLLQPEKTKRPALHI